MNTNDKKVYTPQAILALSDALWKNNEAFQWLMENDYKELGALADVLVNGSPQALQWLTVHGFDLIVRFIDALEENDEAVEQLMTREGKPWAACAQYSNGNDTAQEFLAAHYPHFGKLGDTLMERYNGNVSNSAVGGYSGPTRDPGTTRIW